jgi:hypothetical protein
MKLIETLDLTEKPIVIGKTGGELITFLGHNISPSRKNVDKAPIVIVRGRIMLLMQLEKFGAVDYNEDAKIAESEPLGRLLVRPAEGLAAIKVLDEVLLVGWNKQEPMLIYKDKFYSLSDLQDEFPDLIQSIDDQVLTPPERPLPSLS